MVQRSLLKQEEQIQSLTVKDELFCQDGLIHKDLFFF